MVIPRALSSGALSMSSYDIASVVLDLSVAFLLANTVVIAAERVVLPWSMCPIVPTLQCGLHLFDAGLVRVVERLDR